MLSDTIVAISTPYGESGIGIIRISGKESFLIADKIFKRKDKRGIFDLEDHSINYGWIINPKNNESIDEVLLSIFKKPKTYTKEDMVEINCHGGSISLKKTLELIINFGARVADPGEFTRRAYINGRIDLTQAEAVLDIIRSKNEKELSVAVRQLGGCIRFNLEELRGELLEILTLTNADIDFNDQIFIDYNDKDKKISNFISKVEGYIQNYEKRKEIESGIKVVICGRTNVGKSSLANVLYGEQKIITSKIAGTTRDSIQIDIFFDGIFFKLVDTAGIRKGRTNIEKICIERSKNEIKKSDCLIMVFDISKRLNFYDEEIIKCIRDLGKEVIWVGNKMDIKKININGIKKLINCEEIYEVSAKNGSGIDRIINRLKGFKNKFSHDIWNGIMINERHKIHLENVLDGLKKIREMYKEGWGEEVIAEEIGTIISELDKIIGRGINKDIIDKIFSQFCIGK